MTTNQDKGFRNYPQKYPRARRKASDVVSQMVELTRKGPCTMVAKVADASFHSTQGYVTAVTELGVVNVYGAPYGSLVPGMRILCRQMGGQSAIRAFVFDGYAPNLSGSGLAGSFGYSSQIASLSTGLALTSSTGVPTSSSYTVVYAYFWYWAFYVPVLPAAKVTLWQMVCATDGTTLAAEYLPTGQLQIRSGDNHGYISTGPVSPHNVHWIIVQPSAGTGSVLIDAVPFLYTGLIGSNDNPSFTAGGAGYQLSLLSNRDGSQLAPLGSWVSKWSFGASYNSAGSAPLQSLGTGIAGLPTQDSELPTAIPQTDVHLLYQLLCEDAAGSSTLADSAHQGGTSASITTGGQVQLIGPY